MLSAVLEVKWKSLKKRLDSSNSQTPSRHRTLQGPPITTPCTDPLLSSSSQHPPYYRPSRSELLKQIVALERELADVNERLDEQQSRFYCSVCCEFRHLVTLFEPCHHTTCQICSTKLANCHMCNKLIAQKSRVYI